MSTPFEHVGRLPFETDNVAIATQDLQAGLKISLSESYIELSHNVLEGHRFAVQNIQKGEDLLSWGMPFGRATRSIKAGEYVCNDGVLEALSVRNLSFDLPGVSNFSDEITPFALNSLHVEPAQQVTRQEIHQYFQGYCRSSSRGVGTRNYIVILGVSSRVAGFVRHIEKKCASLAKEFHHVDGVVGVAHTEGDDTGLNNRDLVLRTLAGFVVHPNTGAVLLIDEGSEPITNSLLMDYMTRHNYPADQLLLEKMSLRSGFDVTAESAMETILNWLPIVNTVPRSEQPISALKIALQCGGSDAFSGISGNPLAGWVAREVIRQGGSANLAETDELVGAEPYILKNVKSRETAEQFLDTIDRFVDRAARHGSSAAGNPSGGNKYRGLYNIYLKSLGAAMKKHPEVRLDEVIEYGERMESPGFYFMDSPGNDLESIAGQVAAGCNMIYFVTGNGSITNFPFVPTVKIVTTSRRFELLREDMDVNAGEYLDGKSMAEVGAETLQLTLEIASGKKSVGELAGHAQVQLWRNWRQPESGENKIQSKDIHNESLRSGHPLSIKYRESSHHISLNGYNTPEGAAFERLGLILPTSLCAGQVAKMAAESLNKQNPRKEFGVDRFVALVHTEGCGASSGSSEEIFMRTMVGHLRHPNIHKALLLEHGCEKTHNDYFRNYIQQHNLDPDELGWASIQLGGGIQKTLERIESWFKGGRSGNLTEDKIQFGCSAIRLGLIMDDDVEAIHLRPVSQLVLSIVSAGGSVVIPRLRASANSLLEHMGLLRYEDTLAYAQYVKKPGFHIMNVPTMNWQEIVTGLGASGVHVIAYVGDDSTRSGHPFVPMLQMSNADNIGDLGFNKEEQWESFALDIIEQTLTGHYTPARMRMGNIDFQVTRGLYGISL